VIQSAFRFRNLKQGTQVTGGVAAMKQSTDVFLRIEAIFDEALAVSGKARAELIDERCQGDAEVAAEVHLLLDACETEEQLTDRLRLKSPGGLDRISTRIGSYVLDRLLGRGGMGAVFLAHRADGQFEQQVAIKLIDLPLATDLFRERFRQERQILAGLQHPYIARLLDGGVTENGDLYLVMEYVDGVPIHRYCEEKHLSAAQRLALFLHVCEAVQFAHQHFVVHRDLKPDNILVSGDGTPRLLDFGTAKLLSPSVIKSDRELTREGFQSFTPQYASPEQVLGKPITTASDTYSLGVLLYLLLTETLPYELKEPTTEEMLRVICQEPPRRPPHQANSQKRLDGDLEAILSKALRKEPQERYVSAESLVADVRAYLGGRPVEARHGTIRYRSTKFMRRHWFGLAATVALAGTLLVGVTGVAWQARVANEERRRAEERSADLRQLSNSLLSELDEAIKQLPGSTGVQKLLVTRVLEHLDRMARDAHGDRVTQLDLVDAYTRLGNIQGNPYDQNLGDPAGGLASLDKAIALALPLTPNGSGDKEALRALATAQVAASEIRFGTARTQEAVVFMQAATKTYERLIAAPDAPPAMICDVASAYGTLGDEFGQTGTSSLHDTEAALAAFRRSIALDDRALGIDPGFLRARRGLSINQMKIGSAEMDTDPAQALKDFRIALQRAEALPPAEKSALVTIRMHSMIVRKEANALVQLGEYSEAIALYGELVPSYKNLAAADPQDLRALADLEVVLNDTAAAYESASDPVVGASAQGGARNLGAAANALTQTIDLTQKMLKKDPANENWKAVLADAQVRLAVVRSRLRTYRDSAALARAGIDTFKDLANKGQASPMILDQAARALTVVVPVSLREPVLAEACAERAVTLSHRRMPPMLLTLAQAYRAAGQIEKSRAVGKEGLALLPAPQRASAQSNLRKLLEAQAQMDK
jgi:tetratricopeptide (TPR) repeat protein